MGYGWDRDLCLDWGGEGFERGLFESMKYNNILKYNISKYDILEDTLGTVWVMFAVRNLFPMFKRALWPASKIMYIHGYVESLPTGGRG